MPQDDQVNVAAYLEGGRKMLQQASDVYGRSLSAEEYWWLGVGLAATTLAELSDKPYAAGRIEQLVDRLGHLGAKGDWLQRFVEELAELDAEGLVWPIFERNAAGSMAPTGLVVQSGFDAESAYFLALAHVAVALAVHREDQAAIGRLASIVTDLVRSGFTPEHGSAIIAFLGSPETSDQ